MARIPEPLKNAVRALASSRGREAPQGLLDVPAARSPGIEQRMQGMRSDLERLEGATDRAYETGRLRAAERLDGRLAEQRERHDAMLSEFLTESGDTGMMAGDPNIEAGLEELLARAYPEYMNPSLTFGGERANVVANMRANIENFTRRPTTDISDADIIEAARDVYLAQAARRQRARGLLED